jgi:hypothetical protein
MVISHTFSIPYNKYVKFGRLATNVKIITEAPINSCDLTAAKPARYERTSRYEEL